MKKIISLLLIFVLMFSITACTNDVEEEVTETADPTPNIVAELYLDYATDEMIDNIEQYENAKSESSETQSEYAVWISLSVNTTVFDLEIVDGYMEYDEENEVFYFVKTNSYYEKEEFSAEDSCIFSMVFIGTMPTTAIIYEDADGVTHCQTVNQSGEDGSVIIWECEVR